MAEVLPTVVSILEDEQFTNLQILIPFWGALLVFSLLYMCSPKSKKTQVPDSASEDDEVANHKPTQRRRSLRKDVYAERSSLMEMAGSSIFTPWRVNASQSQAAMNNAPMYGWYSLATMALTWWAMIRVAINLIDTGSVLTNPALVTAIFDAFPRVFAVFIVQHLFMYSAVGLQMLIQTKPIAIFDRDTKVGGWVIWVLHHVIVVIQVVFGPVVALYQEHWGMSSKLTVCIWSMTNYMKMHSYLEVHRHLHNFCVQPKQRHKRVLAEQANDLDDLPGTREELLKMLAVEGLNNVSNKSSGINTLRELLQNKLDINARLARASKVYPRNPHDTLSNFAAFTLMPTVVYDWQIPRSPTVRWWYVLEKIAVSFVLLCTIWLLVDTHIYPILAESHIRPPLKTFASLGLPMIVMVALIFFFVFEIVLNGIAEATRFADRHFYDPWWNSTTFDEFARMWNRPIHEFLLRHVYVELIVHRNVSRTHAMMITFGISIVLHELIFIVCLGMVRPWFSLFQVSQLPMNVFMANDVFKGKRAGNMVFWYGLIFGIPLIAMLYSREYCKIAGNCIATTVSW